MKLTINGESLSLDDGLTIEAMLRARGYDLAGAAGGGSGEIVAAAAFADTPLADGDTIEIVHFVGGG